jgi:hypothetical protein
MTRISRNLTILFRTERLIARRQLAALRTQTGLLAFAGLVAGLGVIMLNVAAYQALETRMTPHASAFLIALANFGLAGIFVAAAARTSVEEDLKPVTELRDLALAELEADAQNAVSEARELSGNVRRIASDPLGSMLPALIGPLLALLTKGDKK